MTQPTHNDLSTTEHTFGREHFAPPPMALEQAEHQLQASGADDEWDLLQRIRNVGEWCEH